MILADIYGMSRQKTNDSFVRVAFGCTKSDFVLNRI